MPDQPCPGPCNSRYWKALRAYDRDVAAYDPLDPQTSRPEPPDDRLIREWGSPWCTDCQSLIGRQLAQLDTLTGLRAAEDDGHGEAPGDEKGGKRGKSDAPPSQSPAMDDRLDLHSALAAWEAEWRKLNGWDAAPYRGDLARAETEITAWLGKHLRGILASELGEPFGRAILQAHRSMAGPAKAGVRTIRLAMRCPGRPGRRCGLLSLWWEEGSDRVECGDPDCAVIMTRGKYDEMVEALASTIGRRSAGEAQSGAA